MLGSVVLLIMLEFMERCVWTGHSCNIGHRCSCWTVLCKCILMYDVIAKEIYNMSIMVEVRLWEILLFDLLLKVR